MTEITLTLTDHERTRLWLALIDAAEEARSDAHFARIGERRGVRKADVKLLLRVAELLSTSGDAA